MVFSNSSLNVARADQVLQYALLLAGQEDDFGDRRLGPIHLIKYVYLADLAYARGHEGKTFTEAEWTFYKFGPWSQAVNARIQPALTALNADRFTFESALEEKEEWVRWHKRDDHLLEALERALPFEIRVELRQFVHRFGKSTPALLDFVYKTQPMIAAAPGERLDFGAAVRALPPLAEPEAPPYEITEKRRKRLREKLRELRNAAPHAQGPRLIKPDAPVYDEVFAQGIAWLDALAGRALPEGMITVEFADEVWKSSARKGPDVP